MKGISDIIKKGDTYGSLTLTGSYEFRNKVRYVEVICECGNIFFTAMGRLKNGRTKSCGCKRNYYNSVNHITHGFGTRGNIHPIYNTYKRMKTDCYNPNSKDYYKYGAKGVIICDEWLKNFMSFYNWSMKNGWEKGLTIDRFPNNAGNYEPNNCRWADYTMQNRNRDFNINITAFGETKCLQEWYYDNRCSVTAKTIKDRIGRGWKPEFAISTISGSQTRVSAKQTEWIPKSKRA